MTLPDARRVAGDALIALVDRVGFDAVGAGWGHADDGDVWRFYLFTEMVDEKGPAWIWERLLKAFRKLSLPPGMTPLDIVIASPCEWLYRTTVAKFDGVPPGLTVVVEREGLEASGYGIDRIWLLRAKPERAVLERARARGMKTTSPARRFDLKVRQLLAA